MLDVRCKGLDRVGVKAGGGVGGEEHSSHRSYISRSSGGLVNVFGGHILEFLQNLYGLSAFNLKISL
jgi:hypothetical protein